MSNLPGNPYLSLGQETLALAYEQRTANLIAVATAVSENGVYQLDPALIGAAQEELTERLGLGENNE